MDSNEPEVAPEKYPILRFFAWQHLPDHLKGVSRDCADLAMAMAATLPFDAETSAGLRKLLEAKDCFVRAALTAPKAS